jgi:hypothetical protein
MKVEDLIEHLKLFLPTLPVYFNGPHGDGLLEKEDVVEIESTDKNYLVIG